MEKYSDARDSVSCKPSINWINIMKIFSIFSAIDLSIQSRFLQKWAENYMDFESSSRNYTRNHSEKFTGISKQEVSHNYTGNGIQDSMEDSFSTGNHLFISAIFRLVFISYFLHISYKKIIPKRVQPYIGYISSAIVYLMSVHAVTVLLWDSEQANRLSATYITSWIFNLCGIVISGIFVHHVLLNSGAIDIPTEDPNKERDEDEPKSKRDLWIGSRTIPFLTMLKKIFILYKTNLPWILVGYVLLAVKTATTSVKPLLNSQIIDAISSNQVWAKLPQIVLYLSLSTVGYELAASLSDYLSSTISETVALEGRGKLYRNILRQEVGFFDKTKSAEILQRLGTVTREVSHIFHEMQWVLHNICDMAALLIGMFSVSWRLTIVVVMTSYITALPNMVLRDFFKKQWRDEKNIHTKLSSMASEAIRAMKTVKAFANEEMEAQLYEDKLKELYETAKKGFVTEPLLRGIDRASWLIARVIVLLYGGHLAARGLLTPGEFVAFFMYMESLWRHVRSLIGRGTKGLLKGMLKMETFFEYLEREPELQITGTSKPEQLEGEIKLKNVTFSYPSRSDSTVLNGVSFTVTPGQKVALVGPSGGGKTTCVNLIQRFYEPSSGEILLDGRPISEYDNTYFHNQIAMVAQEPVLFGRSIEDNIKYGKTDATAKDIENVTNDANANEFIKNLKKGFKTSAGESGSQLSGGQKQRIAIARGLIRNPKIMLLDEATSALDAESEHLVQDALEKGMQGRTVLIIAHRLSTVRHADKIIVIKDGMVAEEGTHDELLNMNAVYANLVEKQLQSDK